MTTLEILKAARKLIEREEDWCQGDLRRIKDDSRIQRCAMGAIYSTTQSFGAEEARLALLCAIFRTDWQGVADYNDTHTHTEVLQMFDRAIAKLEPGQ